MDSVVLPNKQRFDLRPHPIFEINYVAYDARGTHTEAALFTIGADEASLAARIRLTDDQLKNLILVLLRAAAERGLPVPRWGRPSNDPRRPH